MNPIQRIAKNIGVFGISQILTSILSFILLIYVARYLGEIDYGKYSLALSFTALFVIIADMGISQLIIREIARDKKLFDEYMINGSMIKILLSFLTLFLIILIVNLIGYPQDVKNLVYLFGIYTILQSFTQFFLAIFQAYEKMEYVSLIYLIEKIILISLGLSILFLGYGATQLACVYIFAGTVTLVISLILVFKKISRPKVILNYSKWKDIIYNSLPFGLNGFFAAFFFRIDTVLLSIFANDFAVGIYNAAYNPLLALGGLLTGMFVSAIYPVMSRNFITSKDSLKAMAIISARYMAIIGFPIAIGLFVLADNIILLFYAGQYTQSILVFQILALFIPIRLISSITGTVLTSMNKQGIRTFSVLICAIFNIALNLFLIPRFSYIGAGIATVLSELLLYILFIYFINKYYVRLELNKQFIKPFIASLVMGGFLVYLKEINLFILIFLSILVYFLVLIGLKTFTTQDRYMIKQIITRKK